ncbi:MAG: Alpha,alpha-trehalose phosphorylase [Candidatus Izimaplasma bacterium HR2]|nr:MAG: Alpha,alpha-trehalose phosphorylase [Candidatus Izimaplasma bacterium HR2]
MEKLYRNNRLDKEELLVDETIFSIANGYLGTRGTFIEGYGKVFEYNQTYLNGFYNYYDYFYEENFSGFPQEGQKFVNLIDGQSMMFSILGKPLNINTCEVLSLERVYDLKKGLTIRTIHYKTIDNYEFILTEEKIVSRKFNELIAIRVNIKSLNFDGDIKVNTFIKESFKKDTSKIDPRIHNESINNYDYVEISKEKRSIIVKTSRSNLYLNTSISHDLDFKYEVNGNSLVGDLTVSINPDNDLNITKYIVHTSSLYSKNYNDLNTDIVNKLSNMSFSQLLIYQEKYYSDFWDISYVRIEGNETYERLLNYNIFQLNNSGGESSLHNISAKGLSGEGYEGHYFWDTEIYMIPYFTLTNPKKAKNLLMYRYKTMDKAKKEAFNLGYSKGIKFPWRTINGDETSPYYPAGSAQFHINSDVAYAIIKYYEATNDIKFLVDYGFEMLIETARFLKEAVNYDGEFYHLNGVTGPDEYTTVVDDNYYTNQLLKYHFENLVWIYEHNLSNLSEVLIKLKCTKEEMDEILNISKNIYLPFSKELNIYAQDSSFLKKKKLDLKNIPEDKYPLLLNYHPLYLYKHQVLKQADTMLSMTLLDFDDLEILKDSFDYYEPITTHDSSLSKCIYSILAYKLKNYDLACDYFKKVLETDFLDTHKNTKHGLHVANLGGSYLGFIYGVVGLRVRANYLKINPIVVSDITGYELNVMYHGQKVTIMVDDKLSVSSTGKVSLMIYGELIEINGTYQTALQL